MTFRKANPLIMLWLIYTPMLSNRLKERKKFYSVNYVVRFYSVSLNIMASKVCT